MLRVSVPLRTSKAHPSEIHSAWMCLAVSPEDSFAALSLVAGCRLSTNVNKSVILACVNSEPHLLTRFTRAEGRIRYTSVHWAQDASVPPPEIAFLLPPQGEQPPRPGIEMD